MNCELCRQEEEGEVESGQIIIRVLVFERETSGVNSKSKGLVCRSQEAVVIGHTRKGGRRSMAKLCLGPLGGCCKKSRTEVRVVGGVVGHQEAIGIGHGRRWQCMLGRGAA